MTDIDKLGDRSWYRIQAEHALLESGPASIVHTCPKCHTHYAFSNVNHSAADRIADYLMSEVEHMTKQFEKKLGIYLGMMIAAQNDDLDDVPAAQPAQKQGEDRG